MRVTRAHLGLVLALVLIYSPAPEARQTPAHQAAADLAHELMSPFCPGKLLADCTSPNAGELRTAMAARIAAGESPEALKADLVRQYGREILGAPAAEGVGLVAWLVPALLGLASLAAVILKVAAATRTSRNAQLSAAGVVDAQALSQLDDELRDLD